jgi:acetyl esterase/lipase
MSELPIGYLVNVAILAAGTWAALAPPRPRHSSPFRISFFLGFLLNELPFIAFLCLLASTSLAFVQGDIASTGGWVVVGLAFVTTVGLVIVARRGLQAGTAVDRALSEGLDAGIGLRRGHRVSPARTLSAPFFVRPREVERVANLAYGDAGRRNRLDVFRHRSHPAGCPTMIYLHGGAFRIGNKNHGGRPLIYRLARQGWVCISANYRLGRAATFPDHLVDVKRVIAWVRGQGREYGCDPAVVFVAGSSAGGHLASMAALTPDHLAFQPGFERADTSVTAAISLNGYYGPIDGSGRPPSSPQAYVRRDAPPFFVAHGDRDTIVIVEDARSFVEKLRSTSSNPVVYAELPWAQHGFDRFRSYRFETVVNAIEDFTAWVRARAARPGDVQGSANR